MTTEEIINILVDEETKTFHCYDTLKKLLNENEEFKNLVIFNIKNGLITGFTNELWDKLSNQNIRGIKNFVDIFKEGYNQGRCTVISIQVSYSLDFCYICGGVLPILKNTVNCIDGSHTWIEYEDKIIDTTLMLIISKKLKNQFGYIEENKYNPNTDKIYQAAKEFTNDTSLKKKAK